ncbi:H-NS family nucleoid-associated regulatory protein [Burkholderia mayonis]|uniref:H-NS histone family protein n=1 Tax=Burkholderia mayonis TaxID=1385591 RepID=UPI0009EC1AF3|nr:H-NS histone family protein [Burkholderia mayonis]
MPTYRELLIEQAALTKRIMEVRTIERRSVLTQVRTLVTEFELTHSEVFGRASHFPKRASAPIKYRDPDSGLTWSGRGREPTWIRGKDRTPFLISLES